MDPAQHVPDQHPVPSDSHQGSADSHPAAARTGTRFYDWIRGLGLRRSSHRWIGGVAGGVADRLGIDPVIVRGLTVVLALFFGVGLLAYGVAWALLPEPDSRIHAEQAGHGSWSTGMTGATIFTGLGLIGPGRGAVLQGDGWFPWPLFWVAGVAALIYWALNRDKSGSRRSRMKSRPEYGGPAPYRPTQSSDAKGNGPLQYPVRSSSWNRTTTGPYSTLDGESPLDRQGPGGDQSNRRCSRPGAGAIAIATGSAVLVGAVVALLNTAGLLVLGGYGAATAWAAAAITLGLSIAVLGLRGRSSGSLGFFAVVALLISAAVGVVPGGSAWNLASNGTWSPTSIGSAQNGFFIAMGRSTVDLSGLSSASPLATDVDVPVNLAAAQVDITLPANIPVIIHSRLAATSISYDGHDISVTGLPIDSNGDQTLQRINQDAPGRSLILQLNGVAGNINITGNASADTVPGASSSNAGVDTSERIFSGKE